MQRIHQILAAIVVAALIFAFTSPANAVEPSKEADRDLLNAITLAGAAAALIPGGQIAAAAAFGFQAGGLLALSMNDRGAEGGSNPDPNHGTIVSVTPTNFTPIDVTGAQAGAVNGLFVTIARIVDDSRALTAAIEKCEGARVDGNPADIALQRNSAAGFFVDLRQARQVLSSDLAAVGASIQNTPVAAVTISISDVLALRDEIVASGFPPAEMALFAQMNATPAEIQGARDEVALVTGETLIGVDLSLEGLWAHSAVVNDTYTSRVLIPILTSLPRECNPLQDVGGTTELLVNDSAASSESTSSSGDSTLPIAAAAAGLLIALAGGGLFMRRRLVR